MRLFMKAVSTVQHIARMQLHSSWESWRWRCFMTWLGYMELLSGFGKVFFHCHHQDVAEDFRFQIDHHTLSVFYKLCRCFCCD